MNMTVRHSAGTYGITVERGALARADRYFDLDRRVLVVTDTGVPAGYAEAVAARCSCPAVATVPAGEESKSLALFERLLSVMLENGFTRHDCVVAVGGGVVGDLAGFTAACYMRGVDFYNAPTTVLSQVDSSVGGKTAVNLNGIKNPVGAFHQPKGVLIDPQVLSTLPPRQIANGLAEALKMAVTFSADLFDAFERGDALTDPEKVIVPALELKRRVVEADEREHGLRRTLNFGHTIGHGVESLSGEIGLLHGECVALGMLPMCAPALRERMRGIYKGLGLPTRAAFDAERVLAAIAHDKKSAGDTVRAIFCETPGSFTERAVSPRDLRPLLDVIREKGAAQ